MNSKIEEQREVYKRKFASLVKEYTQSDLCVNFLKKNGLTNFKFCPFSEKYFEETLELICDEFSKPGMPPESIVFDFTSNDLKDYYTIQLKHFIETGLLTIVLNEENKVIACNGMIDRCDQLYSYDRVNNTIITNLNDNDNNTSTIKISNKLAKRYWKIIIQEALRILFHTYTRAPF